MDITWHTSKNWKEETASWFLQQQQLREEQYIKLKNKHINYTRKLMKKEVKTVLGETKYNLCSK